MNLQQSFCRKPSDVAKPEILSRIAQANTALIKLKPVRRDDKISLKSKVKPCNSIYLYACESWTLTAELEKITQTFEMRCYQILLDLLYKDHVSIEEVRRKIQTAIGEYDELLTLVQTQRLSSFATSDCLLV